MKDSCRVCMKGNKDMRSIFEEPELHAKLQFCTGLLMTQDDGKPDEICSECTQNLEIAHKFKKDCLRSDAAFHLNLLQGIISIKKEPSQSCNHSSWQDEDLEKNKGSTFMSMKMEFPTIEVPVLTTRDDVKIEVKMEKRGRPIKSEVEAKPNIQKDTEPNQHKDRKQRDTRLKCGQCQIQFETRKELSKHKLRHHRKTWICELCGKEISSAKHVHLKCHHPPQFQCDHCTYSAYSKSDLAKHMHIHFGKKKYVCELCPNTYFFRATLLAHNRNMHLKERNHQCDICGTKYFNAYALKRHSETHTKIKRYRCHICPRVYSRRQRLKEHLLSEHGVTLPPGKPGPRPKHDNESDEAQPTTVNSGLE